MAISPGNPEPCGDERRLPRKCEAFRVERLRHQCLTARKEYVSGRRVVFLELGLQQEPGLIRGEQAHIHAAMFLLLALSEIQELVTVRKKVWPREVVDAARGVK